MVHTPKVKAYSEPLDFCKLVRAVVLGYKSVYESVVVVFLCQYRSLEMVRLQKRRFYNNW